MPEKLHELQRLWLIEAVKYNVLPLDDRQIERFVPELAGRPSLIKGNSQILFAGMGRLSENSVVSIKNKSFSVTADIDGPAKGAAEGVFIAQGGRFGGWSLYAKGGKPKFVYNVLGIKSYAIEGNAPIPAGKTQVRMEFAYDGGGNGKGGNVTLFIAGKEVGKGRVDQTQGFVFSADETTDIGYESGTTGEPGLHCAHQPVQRQDPLGADRSGQGRRRRRSLHLGGGAVPRRDGAAVAVLLRPACREQRFELSHAGLPLGERYSRSPQRDVGFDAGQHLFEQERLGHVVRAADFERLDHVGPVGPRGHKDHGHSLRVFRRPELPADFVSVHARHVDVEQDQIGQVVLDGLQRLATAADGPHFVPFFTEQAAEEPQVPQRVVDHEHASRMRVLIVHHLCRGPAGGWSAREVCGSSAETRAS